PSIPAGETREISIDTKAAPDPDSEYLIRIRFDRSTDSEWYPAGYPVAWDEFELPWGKRKHPFPDFIAGGLKVEETEESVEVIHPLYSAKVDKRTGMLASWNPGELNLLVTPLQFDFWRPLTNNDKGAGYQRKLATWRNAGAQAYATSVTVTQNKDTIEVVSQINIPAGSSKATVKWIFHRSIFIGVETSFYPKGKNLPHIPRIGMRCGLPGSHQSWSWFGKGIHENYPDRNRSAWTATHTGIVNLINPSYLDPQEYGLRTEVRWTELSDTSGRNPIRVEASGESLLQIAAIPVSVADIGLARHSIDLNNSDYLTLRIDHLNSGIGGTNSWGQETLPKYRLKPEGVYTWSFLMSAPKTTTIPPDPAFRKLPRQVQPPAKITPPSPSPDE
ncbi:MAG: beta-galactosidase domain 4-containing protein, partial [Verrucomicrobiota bacterium]